MLRSLVESSVRFRLLVLPLAAVLLVAGATRLHRAPVDVLPEISAPIVEIQTESLGLSTAEVEQLITSPMEQFLLNGVKGVETIRSDSVPGLSRIDLVFEPGTSILDARSLVQERLTQTAVLPNVAAPPQMLQPVSSTSRVSMIGLTSTRLSPIALSYLARWVVRPRLLGLTGVANVAIWGQRDEQLQVLVDPARLRARHLTLQQIIHTTGNSQIVSPLTYLNASTPGTGGFLDGPNQRLSIRHEQPLGKPSNLGQIAIEGTHGLRLSDVASIVVGHQPLIGDAVVNGGPGLLLAVDKRPGASTLEVTRRVSRALDELRPGLRGVRIDRDVFRPATFIESATDNLSAAFLFACVLAVLALAAFLLEWRAVLVAVIAIPLSLLTAALVLDLLGYTINALVVAGLLMAVGLVVDNVIATTEDIVRRSRERHEAGEDTSTAIVLEASSEIRSSIAYATLVVVVTVAPVLVAEGLAASFVHPLVLAYGLAVVAAMVMTLTVTPALGALLFSRAPLGRPEPPLIRMLARRYAALLPRAIRTPRRLLLGLGGLGLIGLVLVPFIGAPDRPSFTDRDVLVHFDGTPSTSLPEMTRVTTRTAAALRSIPGVRDAAADVGRAVTSDRVVGTNSGEIWVKMAGSADYDTTLSRIRAVTAATPGLTSRVTTYESERSRQVLAGSDKTLDVRVYGPDYSVLRSEATRVAGVMARARGVHRPRVEGLPPTQPTLRVQVNLASALRHQIKPGDVRRAVATLTSGLTVGNFFQQQSIFDVVVQGVPSIRTSPETVQNLLIDTPGGGTVRLRDVARVSVGPDPTDIRHDAVSRYVDVRAQASNPGSIRSQLQERLNNTPFPLEYHAEVVSASANGPTPLTDVRTNETSHSRFLIYILVAELAVLLLLQAAFGSWSQAFVLFLTLPLATAGALVVAFATGNQSSLGAMAGVLAVVGLAVRPAIMLVTRSQQLELQSEEPLSRAELTLRVARERFGPTIATAITTALMLLPFVVIGRAAGNEITQPLAEVILGGLVTATLVNLFIVPAISLAFGAAEGAATAAGAGSPGSPPTGSPRSSDATT